MSQQMIYGVVDSDGKTLSGSGFVVDKDPPPAPAGTYTLIFTEPFTSLPSVLVTPVDPPSDLLANTENLMQDRFRVVMRLSTGSISQDAKFSFFAIGEG